MDVLQNALKSVDEKVRLQAASILMDRAWGKAITPSDVKVTNGDLNAQHLQALQHAHEARPVAGTDVDKAG